MEAKNKLYDDMHGDGQGQLPPQPPQCSPTPVQQMGPWYPSTTAWASYYALPPQQQQQVTAVNANAAASVIFVAAETFTGAMIYSCFVLWCCNIVFGLIGFVLAVSANDAAVSDPQGARKLGRASYIVSSVGILITIIIVVVLVVLHSV